MDNLANKKLPTFLGIGVEKAGTSSIYEYLNQHPQVYMSPVKETKFLQCDWQTLDPQARQVKINTFEKYAALFDGVTDEVAIGEFSPNYLFNHETSVECIQHYFPKAKLVVILRDPADRAHSDHLMHIRDAINKQVRSLSDQIKYSPQKSFTIRKGYYYEGLKHFIDTFDTEQIKVYLYEDLHQDSIALMQDLYQFIGVDGSFIPDLAVRKQTSQVPKSKSLNYLLRQQNPVRSFAAAALRFLPEATRYRIRSGLMNLNSKAKGSVALSKEDRAQLINLYRDDILKLQTLIDRDLSAWLTV